MAPRCGGGKGRSEEIHTFRAPTTGFIQESERESVNSLVLSDCL